MIYVDVNDDADPGVGFGIGNVAVAVPPAGRSTHPGRLNRDLPQQAYKHVRNMERAIAPQCFVPLLLNVLCQRNVSQLGKVKPRQHVKCYILHVHGQRINRAGAILACPVLYAVS